MTDGERYGRDYGRGGQIPGSGYGHGSGPDLAAARGHAAGPGVPPGPAYPPGPGYPNGQGHPHGPDHPNGAYPNGHSYPDGGGYAPRPAYQPVAQSSAQPPQYGGRSQFGPRPGAVPPPGANVPRHSAGRAEPWRPDRGVAQVPGRSREPAPRGGPPRGPEPRGRPLRKPMPLWQELPLLLIVAFCLAVLIRTFLLQAFFIPSGSMEDTLLVGDRVLVNKVVYDIREPARGEVVVFSGTAAWVPENPADEGLGFLARVGRTLGDLVGMSQPGEKDFIKRVIGLPGDRVSCCDDQGRVLVNGHPLDEADYVLEDSPLDAPDGAGTCRSRQFDEVVVEPEQIFVMGDHRLVSQDSRCQGQVPIGNIIGRAFVVVWPNDRWHSLAAPETFRDVPPAAAADPDAGQTPGAAGASGGSPVPELPAVLLPVLVLSLVRRSDWACSRGSALVACASHRRLSE